MTPSTAGETRAKLLGGAARLVVKLGSNLLAPAGAGVKLDLVKSLAGQVAALRREGREVVLVSSGAIASGMRVLGLKRRPEAVEDKQALAAVGQPELMRQYAEAFAPLGIPVAQVLLVSDDILARRRFLNARKALRALLSRGVLPVANENDTVAVDEIRVGDNDTLSAHVALLTDADALVILTDVDGLYDGNPARDRGAKRLGVVAEITPEIRKLAGRGAGSAVGVGGMQTKVQAAEMLTSAGRAVVIARGTDEDVLARIVRGEDVGTLFLPAARRMSSRKRWLAFGVRTRGAVVVDAGARAALEKRGKSLLPRGVVRVEGTFGAGDAVALKDCDGQEFGRGLAGYSAEEISRIAGRAAGEIAAILGESRGDEVVHRDNLVLLNRDNSVL